MIANDHAAFSGEYGFTPQEGYDPEEYHGVENPYDLLGPIVFTGSSCEIYGGGAIAVKPVGGVYNPPSGASGSRSSSSFCFASRFRCASGHLRVSDVTETPHFLTSLAIISLRSLKTAGDVTLEAISVTSPCKNGINQWSRCQR